MVDYTSHPFYIPVYHYIFNTNNVSWRFFFGFLIPEIWQNGVWRPHWSSRWVWSWRVIAGEPGSVLDPYSTKSWGQAELLVAHGRELLRNFYSMLCSSKYMGMFWNDWRNLKFRWFPIDSLITNAWDLLQIFLFVKCLAFQGGKMSLLTFWYPF